MVIAKLQAEKGERVVAKRDSPSSAAKPSSTLEEDEIETVRPMRNKNNGLMYVDLRVNGKPIRAMIDTGASHNYLASTEVERLGLVLEKSVGRVKAINSAAQPRRKKASNSTL